MGDHDIIFSEINLSLPRIKQKPHKVYQYKKANWEKIEQDLQTTHSCITYERKSNSYGCK